MTDPRTVAITIHRQIGLDTWLVVSGRNPRYWAHENGGVTYSFRFGPRHGLARWCDITYDRGTDTYWLDAYKVKRDGTKVSLAYYTDVYFDRLPELIRDVNNESQ